VKGGEHAEGKNGESRLKKKKTVSFSQQRSRAREKRALLNLAKKKNVTLPTPISRGGLHFPGLLQRLKKCPKVSPGYLHSHSTLYWNK